jgi:hypothetical protein
VAVLDAVGEGLAFVDERGAVLASNGAFRRLAGAVQLPEGQLLRTVLPEPAIDEAVKRAIDTSATTQAQAMAGTPAREVRFRVLPITFANLGTVGLLITEDLSGNPRAETLRLEAAGLLATSLATVNAPLPREAVFALELSRAAIELDETPPAAEVVLMGELAPRLRAADEAPAVYVVRSRAVTALKLLRLELASSSCASSSRSARRRRCPPWSRSSRRASSSASRATAGSPSGPSRGRASRSESG